MFLKDYLWYETAAHSLANDLSITNFTVRPLASCKHLFLKWQQWKLKGLQKPIGNFMVAKSIIIIVSTDIYTGWRTLKFKKITVRVHGASLIIT